MSLKETAEQLVGQARGKAATIQGTLHDVGRRVEESPTYREASAAGERVASGAITVGKDASRGARMVQHGTVKVLHEEQMARKRAEQGIPDENIPQTSSMRGRGSPAIMPEFGRPRATRATIYRYDGIQHPADRGHRPDFGLGHGTVNFAGGSAIPHGAARGSGVPFGTGSAVNTMHVHGFGSTGHTGTLFGGSFTPLGGALGGKTFGMNDGKLNFTQMAFNRNRKEKKN